jgi:hypothetical protein
MSPLVSGNIYKSFTPLFQTLFQLHHGMIFVERLFVVMLDWLLVFNPV